MHYGIQVLRSVHEMEGIREHWTRMQRHPNSDLDFYHVVLGAMRNLVNPHILVVLADAEPKTILVGRIEESRLTLRLGYATIAGPKVRMMTFIHGGLLGDATREECQLLLQHITESLRKKEADLVFFNHLRTDSALYLGITSAPRFYCRDYCPSTQLHLRMSLPCGVQAFHKRLSSRVRGNLRWQSNRLMKEHPGGVRIECFKEPADLERMFHDIEAVAVHTYQRGLGVGFSGSESERARWTLKAEKGWMRTYVLYVDEQAVAFWSGTLYKGTFHSEYMGYNPTLRQYSPGMHLITKVVEQLCGQNDSREAEAVDWGLGDAEYKRILSDEQWRDASPYMFAPTMRGVILNMYRTPVMQLDRVGRMLVNNRLQARVKRLWRDRAKQTVQKHDEVRTAR